MPLNSGVVNRAQEDQQRRKMRAAEDRTLEAVERAIGAQEDAIFHINLHHIKLTADVGILAEIQTEQTTPVTTGRP